MSETKAGKASLIERLRNTPPDAVYEVEIPGVSIARHPVGPLCHEAAARLSTLEAPAPEELGGEEIEFEGRPVIAMAPEDVDTLNAAVRSLARENARLKEEIKYLNLPGSYPADVDAAAARLELRADPQDEETARLLRVLSLRYARLSAVAVPRMVKSDVAMLRGVYGDNDELNFPAEDDLHGIADAIEAQAREVVALKAANEQITASWNAEGNYQAAKIESLTRQLEAAEELAAAIPDSIPRTKKCWKCKGTGRVYSTPEAAGMSPRSTAIPSEVRLKCPDCKGTGTVVTPIGVALAAFQAQEGDGR